MVRQDGQLSRADLARRLDLSKPTVSFTVDALLQQGILQEVGRGRLPAGRSPRMLAFNTRHTVVAGVDLGATNLRLALADLDGEVLSSQYASTPQGHDLPERLAETIHGLRAQDLPDSRLSRVVLGTPGVVNHSRIRYAPNLPAIEQPDFIDRLKQALGCTLEIHNDVNLAAIGESKPHSTEVVVFIAVGTGLGAAVTQGSRIWTGNQGRAGEIGYLPYGSPVGQILEDVLSGNGLSKLYQHFGGKGGAEEALTLGNNAAKAARQVLFEALAYAVVVLTLAYDPSRIVVGGGVGLQLSSHLPEVQNLVAAQIPFVVDLEISTEGELVAQKGAIRLGVQRAYQELLAGD